MVLTHRCPDCGRICESASELADHALSFHVDSPTPAAHIRPERRSGLASKVAVGIAVLIGGAFWVFLALGGAGVFDPESAPERPASVVHRMAVEMEREGQIDDWRSVEPEGGWDVEYELERDGSFGYIRIRGEGTQREELEYQTIDGELEEAMEEAIRERGFTIGGGV